MVKTKNKYNALEGDYFKKLEETDDKAFIQLFNQREKKTIANLEAQKKELEIQKMTMADTTRAADLQEQITEMEEKIQERKDFLSHPSDYGWESFADYALYCKKSHEEYKNLKNKCSEVEYELDQLENELEDLDEGAPPMSLAQVVPCRVCQRAALRGER